MQARHSRALCCYTRCCSLAACEMRQTPPPAPSVGCVGLRPTQATLGPMSAWRFGRPVRGASSRSRSFASAGCRGTRSGSASAGVGSTRCTGRCTPSGIRTRPSKDVSSPPRRPAAPARSSATSPRPPSSSSFRGTAGIQRSRARDRTARASRCARPPDAMARPAGCHELRRHPHHISGSDARRPGLVAQRPGAASCRASGAVDAAGRAA